MARILIAGCGDIGTRLGRRLVQAEHAVWGLKRHPGTLPAELQPLTADLADPTGLPPLPANLDYVVYTAAADGFSEASYRAAYVDGVRNLLTRLQSDGQRPRRIVFTSSTSVYDQCQGEWVDEDSPADAPGFSGRCLRQGENLLWQSPYPATVIRFGGIYGPGRTRLLDMVRSGRATCVAGVYTNRIHSDDCAAALQHLLELPEPAPLYLGVDDYPALQCEVYGWLAERLGVATPAIVAAADAEAAALRANKRCRNRRLRASGFQFHYPGFRDGYAALLDGRE
jgi:nucleoside-diphosphate-sugar epimerase